jgi:hypothetical protein
MLMQASTTRWGQQVQYLRNHRGRFSLGGSNIIQGRLNTNEGEALTLMEAIRE